MTEYIRISLVVEIPSGDEDLLIGNIEMALDDIAINHPDWVFPAEVTIG